MEQLTQHQTAIIWLTTGMELNKFYEVSDEQREILLDIFLDSQINLPTSQTKGYNYYFQLGMGLNTICKNGL